MPDLWARSKSERALIAQLEARRLGTTVATVYSLTTGLWMTWRDTNGQEHSVNEATANKILNEVRRHQRAELERVDRELARAFARENRLSR